MTLIQIHDVTITLTARQDGRSVRVKALDECSLTVRAGEVMGVIGPTGCGKSTLLRAVAGLIHLDSGRILYNGQDQAGVPTRDRGIGMIFQDYALYSHWDVWHNLAFYFKLRRRLAEVPDRVHGVAEILGVDLNLLLGRMPKELSVGQRQQVAIGRCLVRDPKIFLMDEPFANLDAVQRQHARVQLKRLLQRYRVTTLYVTHDQVEAAALCDRVAFMREGRILQVGTYRSLLAWPATVDVAEFIAEPGTQLVQGACLEGHFACPAFSVPLAPHILARTSPGAPMLLRVRPKAVSLAAESDRDSGRISARVEWVELLPMLRIQRVIAKSGDVSLPVELPQDHAVELGEQLWLRVDPDGVDIFDGRTGANLALRSAGQRV